MNGSDPRSEDLEDLRAHIARLTAEQDRIRAQVESLQRYPEPAASPTPKEEKPKAKAVPKFVLTFPHKTPEEQARRAGEIAALAEWVEDVFVPVYTREARAAVPWCAQWYMHPEAIARLHAAWLAWQGLVADAETGGAAGPSNWHRLHLDPMLTHLRSPHGPFSACMTDPDSSNHRTLTAPTFKPHPGAAARRAERAKRAASGGS